MENIPKCYKADNNFAYQYDNNLNYHNNLKMWNFVPTYDKWCLYCNKKDVNKRCSNCKSVFFCDKKCQKKAWKTHKKHCGRNLFTICSCCGKENPKLKCDGCPVKFCDNLCKNEIYQQHKDFDCDYFSNTFCGTNKVSDKMCVSIC